MVEYALAGHGAGMLIDRDSYRNRQWPEDGSIDAIYKDCGCTVIRKCQLHDDLMTHHFLISDPLSDPRDVIEFREEQQANRPETMGNYILYQELLDRYPHYVLRGSAKSGDTFYRQKHSRFGYLPSYRVCSNELYDQQKQWTLKEPTNATYSPPPTIPENLALGDELSFGKNNQRTAFPSLPSRRNATCDQAASRSYHRSNYFYDQAFMTTSKTFPPIVDNRFGFKLPTIYQEVDERSFDWESYRRTHLQFEKAESLHDSHVYDRCNCSMVTSSTHVPPCLVHAANLYTQTKVDQTTLPISSCPCMFCRKRLTENERPRDLPTKEDLKEIFPINDFLQSKKTVTYLSRPSSAPFRPVTIPIANTSTPRYIPSFRQSPLSKKLQQNACTTSPVTTEFGMRLDAEPNHDHSQIFDFPRERDAVFRSLEDYFHMTSFGRPTMIL
ncbi:unnamed protein product [Adineta ricciae]|uniref:Uncharacterized protein n=2 Tax=Adineta ricciae TaxID=249248 RepID=A0A814SN41_ADIRI|nr:unnamed protein product [Adineta ricciae]